MTADPALEEAVDRVSDLLGRQIGLRPQSALRGRLRRCVRDEAAAHGADVNAYVDMLSVRREALQSLFNRITVQESGFFRHPRHFEVLARDILPQLIQPVTMWSAGCANGQEAYSLAMVMEELGVRGTVLATDVSTDALARTAAGSYTTRELSGVCAKRFERHLTSTADGGQVNAALRARVIPVRHNLIGALPEQAASSQVVFCRNVLIYFAPDQTRAFLSRLADSMPAAAVFLGAAESMWSVSDRFRTVDGGDCYYYRPRTGSAIGRPSARGPLSTAGSASRPGPPTSTAPRTTHRAAPRAAPPLQHRRAEPGEHLSAGKAATLAADGQLALDAGDHRSAVVAFRKWAYLSPDDPLAHLHLGLAFQAAGDLDSARRAYAVARRIVTTDRGPAEHAIGGFATSEFIKLVDMKNGEMGR